MMFQKLSQVGIVVCAFSLIGCYGDGSIFDVLIEGQNQQGQNVDLEDCEFLPETGGCHPKSSFKTVIDDSFERDNLKATPGTSDLDFGWRDVINDYGRIIDGSSGNNVEVAIYNDDTLGPAVDGTNAFYFRGRQGHSVHNIYMISQTFDLDEILENQSGLSIIFSFHYLLADLEEGEFLSLEVCNASLENCGISDPLSVDGLNSSAWESVFEVGSESDGNGLNGLNHSVDDWVYADVVVDLSSYPESEFTFRINVRMDEGFIGNDINNGMEDGVAIDNVRATFVNDDVLF